MTTQLLNATSSHTVYLNYIVRVDQTRDVEKIFKVIFDYLLSRPNETFATVEIDLRKNQCRSHLYAKELPPGTTAHLNGRICPLAAYLTTKNLHEAAKEVFAHSGDPQTNRARLHDAGFLCVVSPSDISKMIENVGGDFTLFPAGEDWVKTGNS